MPEQTAITSSIPLIGFCAYSGTGKTTLIKQLIPLLKQTGLRLAVIKHAHHEFDLDQPGKDSYELRKSGADQTVICTHTRMAWITEFDTPMDEPPLASIINRVDPKQVDLILVEGYKMENIPKIELHRKALGKPLMYRDDERVIALACDHCDGEDHAVTCLDLNQPQQVADFIVGLIQAQQQVNKSGSGLVVDIAG